MDRHLEARLLELAAAGDKAAASELIEAHQASLYAYMLRMSGRPDVAEDIVQDAFVRVLGNLDRFDPRFRFSTWLFTIAKRLYVNACQKHKPVYDTDAVGARTTDRHDPGAPALEREEHEAARDAIGRALRELTEEQREIILLFHQQEWPIQQIAEYMGMPEGTVKSHLHRGRRRMREWFELYAPEQAEAFQE
ncbi:MAG: sigma-70 family RNA polymerase sigma factor [Phycisphaerales bacterium]|nr:sigma-70 family RNA polymerase sigma factor [Phycisphaerales bacterium]